MHNNIEHMLQNAKLTDIPNSTLEKVDNVLKNLECREADNVMKRKSIKFIAVVAVITILTAATALAATLNWHEQLIGFLNPTETQMYELSDALDTPAAIVSYNGVTIEVLQTLTDGQGIYVLYELTVPEWIELNDYITFEWWWMDIETRNPSARLMDETILKQSGNRRTAIMHSSAAGGIVENSTVRLEFRDLAEHTGRYDAFAFRLNTLVEGEWILEWELDFVNTASALEVNRPVNVNGLNNHTITTIYISPMSATIIIEGCDVGIVFEPIIRFKNGDELKVYSSHPNVLYAFSQMGKGTRENPINFGTYTISKRFGEIVDVSEIESIIIRDVVIPIN